MREIKAIIQPFMLEKVLRALEALEELPGLTVSEVKGWGRMHHGEAPTPESEAEHRFADKMKLEVVVPEEAVEAIVAAIVGAARTGRVGDGKVFVSPVQDSVSIRTGEHGEIAL